MLMFAHAGVLPLRINIGVIGRADRPQCKAPEACWVETLPTSGNAAIRPVCLSFGCMKSEGRGVPASVRHLDAVLMLRLALLRFSMHLWRQYIFEAVLDRAQLVELIINNVLALPNISS